MKTNLKVQRIALASLAQLLVAAQATAQSARESETTSCASGVSQSSRELGERSQLKRLDIFASCATVMNLLPNC
jgi:hypothetical protein